MRRDAVHLLALSSLAVAQPLFDLLGRNAEYFAVRGSTGADVVVFALAVLLVPPALLLGLEAAAGLLGSGVRRAVHVAFVGLLVALVALEALRDVGAGALVPAIAVGAVAAAAYVRFAPLRSLVTALAAAGLVFLALFLLDSDVSALTFSGEAHAEVASVGGETPVVIVVLDELPLNSLLDARGRLDPVRYPNLAALASHALWFDDATTVSDSTTYAVPAILSGHAPRRGDLPLLRDYPHNVFTFLGGGARLDVSELVTHLCPPRLCRSEATSFGGRMSTLASDTGLVYLHVLLPASLRRRLPSVSEGWENFLHADDRSAQVDRFDRFVERLRASPRRTLAVIHLLLPHTPWQYLPSGDRYAVRYPVAPWGTDEVWTRDPGIVLQSFQRHLLQVAYVDRLIGRLVARLRATGLYDRSLLVVTADHGISFRPGGKRRPAWPANLHDIAYVPLVVKLPHQRAGRTISRHVRTIDVLPTVAEAVGARLPWPVDGRSLLRAAPEPLVSLQKGSGRRVTARAGPLEQRRRQALARQIALFGSDEPTSSLYGIGRFRALLGRRVPGAVAEEGGRAKLVAGPRGAAVQVSGRVSGHVVHDVALAISGRIVAVVPAFAHGRESTFWALVPSRDLGSAATVAAFALSGRASAPKLAALGFALVPAG
jgi:hypothetical protein